MQPIILKDLIHRYEEADFIVTRRLNALIRELMPESITVDQYATLCYLNKRGRCTSTELADIFCVGKSSITAIITRLSDKGYTQRMPEEKDRRITHLALTEQGEEMCRLLEEKVEGLLGQLIQFFTEEEAIRFIKTYEKLAEKLTKI